MRPWQSFGVVVEIVLCEDLCLLRPRGKVDSATGGVLTDFYGDVRSENGNHNWASSNVGVGLVVGERVVSMAPRTPVDDHRRAFLRQPRPHHNSALQ
jgi:hypothetical protein